MFLSILFLLWAGMLIFSLLVGTRQCQVYQVKAIINFTQRGIYNYTMGLHHAALVGQDNKGGKFRIETLTVGIILVSFEISFFKTLPPDTPVGPAAT